MHIAIAEDNPSDVEALKSVLDRVGFNYTLTIALDGEEPRKFILKKGRYQGYAQQTSYFGHEYAKVDGLRSAPANPELRGIASVHADKFRS